MTSKNQGLLQRLADGPVLCAEGYVFELERRGYLKAGAYVPEVVIEHPEVVSQLHHEFARAGTDVQVALTYYANREKLKAVGREGDLEQINRTALRLAKKAAKENGALVAANICNTSAYDVNHLAESEAEVRRQYTEQVTWAVEEGVDFVLAETLAYVGEALIALEVIKKFNLPAVINLSTNREVSNDGYDWIEACQLLEAKGADVVGFNCGRGPASMLPLLRTLRKAVKIPIAAVPVPYRTTLEQPSFQSFVNTSTGKSAYTVGLDEFLCTRQEMAGFAAEAHKIGVEFIGICCGAGPHHVRAMAEALGRTVPASRYSPDMSQHYLVGSKKYAKTYEKAFLNHFAKP